MMMTMMMMMTMVPTLSVDMMMVQVEGSSRVEGSISYVAQQAWIQNMTVDCCHVV